jgi:hypothetical protein
MGFSQRHHAKTSLLNSCKIDVDYTSTLNRATGRILEDKQGNFEIIRLSARGLNWFNYYA